MLKEAPGRRTYPAVPFACTFLRCAGRLAKRRTKVELKKERKKVERTILMLKRLLRFEMCSLFKASLSGHQLLFISFNFVSFN